MDKVHGPYIIDSGGRAAAFPQLRFQPAFGCSHAQGKAHLLVKPTNPLAVDVPAFASEQHMETAIAVARARFCDLLDPAPQWRLIASDRPVVVHLAIEPEHGAAAPFTDPIAILHPVDDPTQPTRR